VDSFSRTICWKGISLSHKLHIFLFYLKNKISKSLTHSWFCMKTIQCSCLQKTNQRFLIIWTWDQCLSHSVSCNVHLAQLVS
jgi:hypothetical protein